MTNVARAAWVAVGVAGMASVAAKGAAQEPVGVAAATVADGPVLVFGERRAWVSADGRGGFLEVFGEPDGTIAAGAIDQDGVWALVWSHRDGAGFVEVGGLGGPRGGVRRVAFDSPWGVVLRAGVLVVRASDGIHVSKDRGVTFVRVSVPEPCAGCGGVLGSDVDVGVTLRGTVIVSDTEINTCSSSDILEWMRVMRLEGTSLVAAPVVVPARTDYAVPFHVGAYGWLYGVGYAHRLVAYGNGRATPLTDLHFADRWPVLVADNGRLTLAVVGDQLVELHQTRARVLTSVPREVGALAVDGNGRALVTTERGLERFSRARGWELVFAP